MSEAIQMVINLLSDPNKDTGYLTGRAGTGKTTEVISICQYLYDNQIPFVVCAYTHKACEVLSDKFPPKLKDFICTLHSFLGKRPGINDSALSHKYVTLNYKGKVIDRPHVLIIDEFSMVGEKDLMDIVEAQEPLDEVQHTIKVLMVGDPYQLPPVGDMQTIVPRKPHWVHLTIPRRSDKDDIVNAMSDIVSYIDGTAEPKSIPSSEHIIREQDIVQAYLSSKSENKKVLAWTNEAVQNLNAQIEGKAFPEQYDTVFCTSNRKEYLYLGEVPKEEVTWVETVMGTVLLGTKYKTLEFLLSLDYVKFLKLECKETSDITVIATIFGMKNYLVQERKLTSAATTINREIASRVGPKKVIQWCEANSKTALSVARRKAWREVIVFKDATMQIDFNHAITVHKSQGSTYEEVYVDTIDLGKCADRNFELYLKLLYVALSRASKLIVTN